jgi:hypothetical protein
MESTELTEEQFKMIKMLCANRVLLINSLHPQDTDPEAVKTKLAENLVMLTALTNAGLLECKNEEIKEQLEFAKTMGQRTFDVYALTDLAYKMFSPVEGSIN